ncbi:MAG: FKBP-type peptidyl-prolyl cis-trans isomerase [Elusimicrobia bacterium]|nr:FKBP-type peptidyl-prolyl cis-trans isomerase [Elusimicrobiota bacterium]
MNRLIRTAVVLTLAAAPLMAADAPTAAPAATTVKAPAKPAAKTPAKHAAKSASGDAFKDDNQRAAYAYGYKIGQNLAPVGLSETEVKDLAEGLRDAASGKNAAVNMAVYLPKVQELIQGHLAAKIAPEKKKGAAFAEKFAKEPGVKPIDGGKGGYIQMLTEGKGAMPSTEDTVKVNYRGTLINGTEFDSSYKRNEPATFPLNHVIPCWTRGVAMMKVGGKAKLVCPSDIAYGDAGEPRAGIAGGSTLVFEVELLDVTKADAPAEPKAGKK